VATKTITQVWQQVEDITDPAKLRELVGAVLDVADNYALIESDQIVEALVEVLDGSTGED
jgi:hypothetical protein